jgi:hypothetical protein
MEAISMSKQSLVIVMSAALLAGLSGIARADAIQHPSQTAKMSHPISEATLQKLKEKLKEQHVYGMAIANPQSVCVDITCEGFALIGIGF